MRQNEVVATVNNDNNKEGKAMKGFRGFKQKLVAGAAGAMMAVNMLPVQVFAAGTGTGTGTGTSSITQPLENLKTLVIAVIGAVGVIILAKNVMEFAQAYQQQDSSTMNSALKGIVAGIMMAGISTVLTFLGF
ncbi:MAG: electron transporter RnfA [Lachnospiraceae bacterium]|nr:electron transporter RnfA [Lachnospiraceae bacterium]